MVGLQHMQVGLEWVMDKPFSNLLVSCNMIYISHQTKLPQNPFQLLPIKPPSKQKQL